MTPHLLAFEKTLIVARRDVARFLEKSMAVAKECPLKPLNDRVVVAPEKPAEKVGSLYMPEDAVKKLAGGERGVVVAVGPGPVSHVTGNRSPLMVRVGDVVWFGKFAGTVLKNGDAEVRVLREDEILVIDNG